MPGSENVDANQVFGVKNDYGSGSAAAVLNPTDTKHPAVEAAEARRGNPKSRLNHPMGWMGRGMLCSDVQSESDYRTG